MEPKCSAANVKQTQDQKFEYELLLDCVLDDWVAHGFPDTEIEPSIGSDIYYKVTDQRAGDSFHSMHTNM